jgi:hypothetical protein
VVQLEAPRSAAVAIGGEQMAPDTKKAASAGGPFLGFVVVLTGPSDRQAAA